MMTGEEATGLELTSISKFLFTHGIILDFSTSFKYAHHLVVTPSVKVQNSFKKISLNFPTFNCLTNMFVCWSFPLYNRRGHLFCLSFVSSDYLNTTLQITLMVIPAEQ